MRSLILLIVASAFLLWFGNYFRYTNRKLGYGLLMLGGGLGLLALVGVLRLV